MISFAERSLARLRIAGLLDDYLRGMLSIKALHRAAFSQL